MKCEDVDEAHKMSAMVFGIERPVHISGDYDRVTDSMNRVFMKKNRFVLN